MSIQENNQGRFRNLGPRNFTVLGFWLTFLVDGLDSFLWYRAQIHLESNWLLPKQACLYHQLDI